MRAPQLLKVELHTCNRKNRIVAFAGARDKLIIPPRNLFGTYLKEKERKKYKIEPREQLKPDVPLIKVFADTIIIVRKALTWSLILQVKVKLNPHRHEIWKIASLKLQAPALYR